MILLADQRQLCVEVFPSLHQLVLRKTVLTEIEYSSPGEVTHLELSEVHYKQPTGTV